MSRKKYLDLRKAGKNNRSASQLVGVSEATGSRIWKLHNSEKGSLATKPPGRQYGVGRRLTSVQSLRIKKLLLDHTPNDLNLGLHLWTRKAVGLAIMKLFNKEIPLRTITDYLNRWDYSPPLNLLKVCIKQSSVLTNNGSKLITLKLSQKLQRKGTKYIGAISLISTHLISVLFRSIVIMEKTGSCSTKEN